jgi:hypothetical protein
MKTVVGNETLVLDCAQRYPHLDTFGLNPGLISTQIRAGWLGDVKGFKFRLVESMIGFFNQSADAYARRMIPLLGSPDLEGKSGAMFNNKAIPIHKSKRMSDSYVEAVMEKSEALVERALA